MSVRRVLARVKVTSPELGRPLFSKTKAFPGDTVRCTVKKLSDTPLKLEDLVFRLYLRTAGRGGWSPLLGAITDIKEEDGGYTGELRVPRVDGGKLCFFVWSKLQPERQFKSQLLRIVERKPVTIKRMDSHFLPGREQLRVWGKVPLWAKFMRVEVFSQARTRRGRGGRPIHWEVMPVTARKGLIYQWNGIAQEGPQKGKPLTYYDAPFLLRCVVAEKKEHLEPKVDPLAAVPSNGRPFHLEVGRIELYYAPDPGNAKDLHRLQGTVNILEKGADDGSDDKNPAPEGATLGGVAREKLTVVAKLFLKSRNKVSGRKSPQRVVFAPELFGKARPKLFWRQFKRFASGASRSQKKDSGPVSDFEQTPQGPFPGELVRETELRHVGRANVEKVWHGYGGANYKPVANSNGPFTLGAVYPRYRVQRQSTRAKVEAARFTRFKLRWLKVLPRIIDVAWGAEAPQSGSEIELFGVVKGLPEGTSVKVEVSKDKKVLATLPGKTAASGGVLARWTYEYDEDIKEIPLPGQEPKGPRQAGPFQFTMKVPGIKAVAGEVSPKDAIEFILEDEDGEPMCHQDYKLHLPDGEVIDGRTDDKGRIYHENVPAGRCDLEIVDDEPQPA